MTIKNSMTFGKKITALRRASCMTQEELGFSLCVSRQTIAQWEADSAPPKADKIIELCKLFNVSADYLLFDDDEQGEIAAAEKECPKQEVRSRGAKAVSACGLGVGIMAFLIALMLAVLLLFGTFLEQAKRYSSDFNTYASIALIVGLLVLSAMSITLSVIAARKGNGKLGRRRKKVEKN